MGWGGILESFCLSICSSVRMSNHVLTECADLLEIRKKYFEDKSLYSLFWNVIPEVVFDFLHEIGVFYKI